MQVFLTFRPFRRVSSGHNNRFMFTLSPCTGCSSRCAEPTSENAVAVGARHDGQNRKMIRIIACCSEEWYYLNTIYNFVTYEIGFARYEVGTPSAPVKINNSVKDVFTFWKTTF